MGRDSSTQASLLASPDVSRNIWKTEPVQFTSERPSVCLLRQTYCCITAERSQRSYYSDYPTVGLLYGVNEDTILSLSTAWPRHQSQVTNTNISASNTKCFKLQHYHFHSSHSRKRRFYPSETILRPKNTQNAEFFAKMFAFYTLERKFRGANPPFESVFRVLGEFWLKSMLKSFSECFMHVAPLWAPNLDYILFKWLS